MYNLEDDLCEMSELTRLGIKLKEENFDLIHKLENTHKELNLATEENQLLKTELNLTNKKLEEFKKIMKPCYLKLKQFKEDLDKDSLNYFECLYQNEPEILQNQIIRADISQFKSQTDQSSDKTFNLVSDLLPFIQQSTEIPETIQNDSHTIYQMPLLNAQQLFQTNEQTIPEFFSKPCQSQVLNNFINYNRNTTELNIPNTYNGHTDSQIQNIPNEDKIYDNSKTSFTTSCATSTSFVCWEKEMKRNRIISFVNDNKKYVCNICGNVYKSKSHFSAHYFELHKCI